MNENDPFTNPYSSTCEPVLAPDDQRVVDALAEVGFEPQRLERLNEADALRVRKLSSLLGLMKDYPVEDADDTLIHATLARIDRYEDQQAERLRFGTHQDARSKERAGGRRVRLPDFITLAAVLLIAVSVFWPVLTTMKNRAIDETCSDNLRQMGYAFNNYAADNGGALPLARAGVGGSWDSISNVLNLKPLIEGGYCDEHGMNCPGHEAHAERGGFAAGNPSYSYRWFSPGARQNLHWNTGRVTVVIGDRNPVVDAARSGMFVPPLSMSINHNGRGQNVLCSDGATMWLEKPVVGSSDNIWLPTGTEQLRPGLQPSEAMDVFLTH